MTATVHPAGPTRRVKRVLSAIACTLVLASCGGDGALPTNGGATQYQPQAAPEPRPGGGGSGRSN